MADIVERLRQGKTDGSDLSWRVTDVHREAANEIERLRVDNKALTEALSGILPDGMEDGDAVLGLTIHLTAKGYLKLRDALRDHGSK